MAQKTALIVFAHQNPASFNAAARDVAVQELKAQGYRVLVSDLYAMKFRPAATRDDVKGELKNPDQFEYGNETMLALKENRLSDDIVAEHQKIIEAELIIFQFPLYWFSVPAILKGWFDRVMTRSFAYSLAEMYNNPRFEEKKAMLSFSTGASQIMFQPDGFHGDINVVLWPLQNGILRFCGFQVLAPQIFYSPAHNPPAVRTSMLEGWRARLKGLMLEKPLSFPSVELFDLNSQDGFRLKPEVKKEQEKHKFGITTGHHLGKPLPPDNQTKAGSRK
ncbi:NAD(P)H dehydrogenase [quinone] 1-like isoform X2 [Acanthochromis polyacanthus]|uniref:NAD(P)H dehydrogenase [quinone] 1-like isoform X1 n=1 Tax=Acanthochromis polyacanthus TaxID=80966 RepID=UPI002234D148|nr:NAD(P)H dehydrogenase [quinone] 1-like isoform X1 [Acanthochromis polyacanthus]XP_051794815.1 NAD(P)H dehydrogenase [quinone] 1-like isoform X2 [Acanthochromis polyacanthus]XP_051794830.1 NAD(P)H dehydrogenase [quinone] 1-like isoform X2 [Acanthochromis polyacanthus]